MITDDYMIIESHKGWVRIIFLNYDESYLNLNAREAESLFRQEYGLKGKRIRKQCR